MRAWGKAAHARLSTWALRRQGMDEPPFVLASRRLYILPTRRGAAFAVVLLGMLFGGLNYANSLVLLLTFALVALCAVAMLQCHRRLRGLSIDRLHVPRVAAGRPVRVEVAVTPARDQEIDDLRLRFVPIAGTPGPWSTSTAGEGTATAVLTVHASPAPRGPWQVPRLRIESRAPFGLFKCWAWVHATTEALVWPAPRGNLPLPRRAGDARGSGALEPGRDEWVGLRPFRDGDSPRLVAWKAYARGGPLLVREFREARGAELRLDYATVPQDGVEARLSQLARWIDVASAEGVAWSLHLPGRELPAGHGAGARHRGLDALARHGFGGTPR